MSEPTSPLTDKPAPNPQTPNEEGSLITRGPSGIIALAAVIIAAGAIGVFFRKGLYGGIDERNPPSTLAINLSFCAILMAFLALYRARGMITQKWTRIGSAVAIILGLGGPVIAVVQVVHWHKSVQYAELRNLTLIAKAAGEYAKAHENKFPPGFINLVLAKEEESWRLPLEALRSPFRTTQPLADLEEVRKLAATDLKKAEALVMEHSDYVYLGADLPGKGKYAMQMDAGKLIIASSKQPKGAAFEKRLGESIPVAWANGQSRYVPAPEMDNVLKESNAARADRDLQPMDQFGALIPK